MPGIVVIASYRPKPDRMADFHALLQAHVPLLRALGYVSGRQTELLQEMKGDCVVEIFEWDSREAAMQAANNATVRDHWKRMQEAAEFVPLSALAESVKPFCHFVPLDEK